jgi:hypothetical protein
MNERGFRVRFIRWSELAASAQQDRLRKCGLTFVTARTALTRRTKQIGQHDDQQWPGSSGQKHHAPGVDGKSLTDGLGAFRRFTATGHARTVLETEGGRAATEAKGARWVNVVLSNVKRALDGVCHSVKQRRYARRYLAEAAYRFNRRL